MYYIQTWAATSLYITCKMIEARRDAKAVTYIETIFSDAQRHRSDYACQEEVFRGAGGLTKLGTIRRSGNRCLLLTLFPCPVRAMEALSHTLDRSNDIGQGNTG
jgi:hypothetical protein